MDTSRPALRRSPTRKVLRTLSNGHLTRTGGWSTSAEQRETAIKQSNSPRQAETISARKSAQSLRRQLSKSYGDLSKLRPKSPPIYGLSAQHLLSGELSGDVGNASPSYNHQNRQFKPTSGKQSGPTISPILEDPMPPLGSRSRNLVSSKMTTRPGAIIIQGLNPGIRDPLDFCKPFVRTYPSNANQRNRPQCINKGQALVVEHINMTTSWNGLQLAELQELYRIHQAFRMTINNMLTSELWKIYQEHDKFASTLNDEDRSIAGILRGISFSHEQLVHHMTDSLYSSKEDMVGVQPGLVGLYLAASDCLVQHIGDHSRDTSITVRVYSDRTPNGTYPAVEASWIPDYISFTSLDEFPREGQELVLVPQYRSNSAFQSNCSPMNIKYSVEFHESSLSWLTWDNRIGGFRGMIPTRSQIQQRNHQFSLHTAPTGSHQYQKTLIAPAYELCIVVNAVFTNNNSSFVHYERIIRARLTLKVLSSFISSNSSTPSPLTIDPHCFNHSSIRPLIGHMQPHLQGFSGADQQNSAGSLPFPRASTLQDPDLVLDVAQEHAYLAAKYVDMAQRHSDAEQHVRSLGSLSRFGDAQDHEPITQFHSTRKPDYLPFIGHLAKHEDYPSGSSESYTASDYIPEEEPSLRYPYLKASFPIRQQISDAASPFKSPSPVVRSTPSQTFDEKSQAWHTNQLSLSPLSHQMDKPQRTMVASSASYPVYLLGHRDEVSVPPPRDSGSPAMFANAKSEIQPKRMWIDPRSMPTPPDSVYNHSVPPPDNAAFQNSIRVSSLETTYREHGRTVSLYSRQGTDAHSRVSSSGMQISVQDACERAVCREQARAWSKLEFQPDNTKNALRQSDEEENTLQDIVRGSEAILEGVQGSLGNGSLSDGSEF